MRLGRDSALALLFAALSLAPACSDENAFPGNAASGTGGTARGGSTATSGTSSGGRVTGTGCVSRPTTSRAPST